MADAVGLSSVLRRRTNGNSMKKENENNNNKMPANKKCREKAKDTQTSENKDKATQPEDNAKKTDDQKNESHNDGNTPDNKYQFNVASQYYMIGNDKVTSKMAWSGLRVHTTCHGIPHVDNARGMFKKVFWSTIFAAAVIMLVLNMVLLFIKYFSYDVDVTIQMHHDRELFFPTVTICNMNPVKLSKINQVPDIENLINDALDGGPSNEGKSIKGSKFADRVTPRDAFVMEEKLAEILAGLTADKQKEIGFQPYEIILDCQYAGYQCYWQEFTHIYNTILGNCYMFNSGWNNQSLRISHKTGRRYGLKLVLNIMQDEYLPEIGEAAGIRVVVHPQDKVPFPQDEGIVVSPGVLTSMGLRQLTVSRKSDPYGNCTDPTISNNTRNVFEEYYDVKYSATACYKTCYQRFLIERCGCSDAQFPSLGEAFGNVVVEPCHSDHIDEDDCKYETSDLFNQGILDCPDCLLSCSEVAYQPEISHVEWPSDVYEETLLEDFASHVVGMTSADDPDKYRRNLLKLEVYYEEFNYENIDERPSYDVGQFASDIGGVIGLWVGCSIMSIFEFIEFFMDLMVIGCNKSKCYKGKKKTKQVQPHNNKKQVNPPPTYNDAVAKREPDRLVTPLNGTIKSAKSMKDILSINDASRPDSGLGQTVSRPKTQDTSVSDLADDVNDTTQVKPREGVSRSAARLTPRNIVVNKPEDEPGEEPFQPNIDINNMWDMAQRRNLDTQQSRQELEKKLKKLVGSDSARRKRPEAPTRLSNLGIELI